MHVCVLAQNQLSPYEDLGGWLSEFYQNKILRASHHYVLDTCLKMSLHVGHVSHDESLCVGCVGHVNIVFDGVTVCNMSNMMNHHVWNGMSVTCLMMSPCAGWNVKHIWNGMSTTCLVSLH